MFKIELLEFYIQYRALTLLICFVSWIVSMIQLTYDAVSCCDEGMRGYDARVMSLQNLSFTAQDETCGKGVDFFFHCASLRNGFFWR